LSWERETLFKVYLQKVVFKIMGKVVVGIGERFWKESRVIVKIEKNSQIDVLRRTRSCLIGIDKVFCHVVYLKKTNVLKRISPS